MDYFNDPQTAKNSKNPLVSSIDAAVREARNNEKWRHDYMTWQMYGNEKYDEGMEEGWEKGRTDSLRETAIRMYSKGMDIYMIAEMLEETEEQIRQWVFATEN